MNRPDAHVTDTFGRTQLRAALEGLGWTVNPTENDYGSDFDVEVFQGGKSTGIAFKVQLKSSRAPQYSENGEFVSVQIPRGNAEYMCRELRVPMVLVQADVEQKKTFWIVTQLDDKVLQSLSASHGQSSVTFRIPTRNRLPATWEDLLLAIGQAGTRISMGRTDSDPRGYPDQQTRMPSSRAGVVDHLHEMLARPDLSGVLVVTGVPGSGASSLTKDALCGLAGFCLSISLSQVVGEPLFGQSSQEVGILRRVATMLGGDHTSAFARAWEKYERCFRIASHIRTMVERSGYGSLCQNLQAVGRSENLHRRRVDPLRALKRVFAEQEDIELILRPQRHLLAALSSDLAQLQSGRITLHFHDICATPEAPLVALLNSLATLTINGFKPLVVASLEARPVSYPLLRKFAIFHVPASSSSEVIEYLRETLPGVHGRQLVPEDDFIVQLSCGSLSVADFLRQHPRLLESLSRIEHRDPALPIKTPLEAWCLLAAAYDVTPALVAETLGLTDIESALLAEDIPDEWDGGRRLPAPIAGAVISVSTPDLVRCVNSVILNHLRKLSAKQDDRWSAPTRVQIGLGFHTAWHSGSVVPIDRCLLRNYRTTLSLCATLHAALSRLHAIGMSADTLSDGIADRLAIIERIEAGSGDDDIVIRFFERITENRADFSPAEIAVAYYQLGHCYFSRGEDELAGAALEYAIELDSGYYNAWSLLGVVYEANSRPQQSVTALQEALRLNGQYEFAHFNLGAILERRGRFAQAAHSYAAAIRCEPAFYEAAYNLSNVLLELELFEEAVHVATYTGDIAHELRVEPIFNVATALANLGELTKAIRLFRSCLGERQDPRFAYNLGLAYAALGQTTTAMDVLRDAELMARDHSDVHTRWAATDVRRTLKAGEPFLWQSRSVRMLLNLEEEADLKREMDELFGFLRSRGFGLGSKGIRRTVSKVATHVAADKNRLRAEQERQAAERTALLPRRQAGAPTYARLPSYGGG